MENEENEILNRKFYSFCKKVVEKEFPEELEIYDVIWNSMKDVIHGWSDVNPDEWPISDAREQIVKGIGFTSISNSIDFVTPIIIATFSATMIKIKDLGYIPKRGDVEKIIENYGSSFKVKGILINQLKSYFADLCEALPKLSIEDAWKEESEELRSLANIKEEANVFARMWTLKTDNPESGDVLSEKEYKNICKRRKKIPLLIIKQNGFKDIYVYGMNKELTLLLYDLLEYILKHKGRGGDVLSLLENVWKSQKRLAQHYRQELEKAKQLGTESHVKIDIYQGTSHVRKSITLLNRFLNKNFNVYLRTQRKEQYKLTRPLEYYLIEII